MNYFPRRRSLVIGRIEIRGQLDFCFRTREAIRLLQPCCWFNIIESNIRVIRQGRRSGMRARAKKPTFVVGRPTWQHSALWYAGAIAHDAYHSKLYHEAKKANGGKEPNVDAWTGVAAEKKCLSLQRQVLIELNADPKTIGYIEECEKNPTYQGRNKGWRAWLDYLRRWW